MADDLKEYQLAFNNAVLEALKSALAEIYRGLKANGTDDETALQVIKQRIDQTALSKLCPQIFGITAAEYSKGTNNLPVFNWDIQDTEALSIMSKNNVFLTSKYIDNIDMIDLRKRMQEAFTGGQSPTNIYNKLKFELNKEYTKLKAYNEMLITTVTTTARNFSAVNSLVKAGVKYSRIFGFRDELTCPICKRLIGKTIAVSDQEQIKNDYLAIDYEALGYDKALERIKKIKPWLNEKQLIKAGVEPGKEKSGVMSAGMMLPPFHARCRCEVVIDKKANIPLETGGKSGITDDYVFESKIN